MVGATQPAITRPTGGTSRCIRTATHLCCDCPPVTNRVSRSIRERPPLGFCIIVSCDTNCQDGANWGGFSVGGLAAGNGQVPDLALDAQNRPRIVYHEDSPDGLGYAWCTANCELDTATWQIARVESGADLEAEWHMLPPYNCSSAYWYAGYRPSIALDASGNPRIGSEGHALARWDMHRR